MPTSIMGTGTDPGPPNPDARAERAEADQAFRRVCIDNGDASLPEQLGRSDYTTSDPKYHTREHLREKMGLRKRCLAVMRALNDDNADLTDHEQRAFDRLAGVVDHLNNGIEFIRERLDGRTVSTGPDSGRVEWKDSDGRPVALLRPNDSFADAVCRQTGANHRLPRTSLAATIQGMVTGDFSQAHAQAQASGFSASLVEGADPQGGYFVTPALAGEVIDHARARSTAIQAGTRTLPMESPEVRLVRVDDDPEFQFTGEKQEFPVSDVPFGMVRLVAKKQGVAIPVSRELIEDAVGLQAELDKLLGESLASSIDKAIYQGDGAKGSFTGILHASGVQEHAAAFPKLLHWDDLLESQFKLETANLGTDAMLVLPPSLAKQLRGQKDQEGRYIAPPSDFSELRPAVSTNLPATDGVYGRFAEGILGIRAALSIQVNPFVEAKRDMVLIIARWRGDYAITRPAGLVKLTDFDGTTE